MSALLVSVRSAEEARAALAGGAAVIDVKEPRRGSLGRAEPAVWREVVAEVKAADANEVAVSVALGELLELRSEFAAAIPAGVTFAKVGLAGCRGLAWQSRWLAWRNSLPAAVRPVLAVYVDSLNAEAPTPDEVAHTAAELGAAAVLLDTFDKQHGDLFSLLAVEELEAILRPARESGIPVALAGSLKAEHFAAATELNPRWIAVRGAACVGGRTGGVSAERVRRLRAALESCTVLQSGALTARQASPNR